MAVLTLEDISISWGDRDILNNVSFQFEKGKKVALAGANGEGKTTLLNIITGNQEADSGRVIFSKGSTFKYLKQIEISNSQSTDSPGEKMKKALYELFESKSDFLFLDEPTNYLDIESRQALSQRISKYQGGIIIVSHDRAFLDSCVQGVFELFLGKIKYYPGTYTQYETIRRSEIEELKKLSQEQEELIEKTEAFIEKFRYKATKARQVQERIRMLDKLEKIEIPEHLRTAAIKFPPCPQTPKDQIFLTDVGISFSERTLFSHLNCVIKRGDKLCIAGRNGQGKSTLLKIIIGKLESTGSIKMNVGVSVSYFAQESAKELNPTHTVLEEICLNAPSLTEKEARNLLGAFLFRGDDVNKMIKVLSGGERERLAILKVLTLGTPVVILDEATNHLDIATQDVLLGALKQTKQTIIFVTHDESFMRGLATSFIRIENGKATRYDGDWNYYTWKIGKQAESLIENNEPSTPPSDLSNSKPQSSGGEAQVQPHSSKEAPNSAPSKAEARLSANRERNKQKKNALLSQNLMDSIEELETRLGFLNDELEKPEVYSDREKSTNVISEIDSLKSKIDNLTEQWLALSDS